MQVPTAVDEDAGLVRTVAAGGLGLLLVVAGSLFFAGGFAIFLAASGEFLPHDIRYLGMSAADLCSLADCRIVGFMVHDRAAFGGALCAIGALYLYVILFPLRRGEAWAWWLLLFSGSLGFLTFLAYLGYGYLDTWHGLGTLLLAPFFAAGLALGRRSVRRPGGPGALFSPGGFPRLTSRHGLGRACLLAGALGTAVGGLTILWVGVTDVFVPADLAFIGLSADQLRAVNPRLVSLIAHDRVGFGGAVFTTGLTAFACLWHAPLSRALWETMLFAGTVSLGAAVGTHLFVGYLDLPHLAPPAAAIASLVTGLALTVPRHGPMRIRTAHVEELPVLRDIERAAGQAFRGLGMADVADDEPPPLDALARHQRAGLAWVATDAGDQPIAYLVAELVDGNLHVEQVSVHPDSARRGVGRQLLDHAAGHARAAGMPALTLTTFADVPWNAPYYLRCGFRTLDESDLTAGLRAIRRREAAHGLDRWPRVCMRRDLSPVQG